MRACSGAASRRWSSDLGARSVQDRPGVLPGPILFFGVISFSIPRSTVQQRASGMQDGGLRPENGEDLPALGGLPAVSVQNIQRRPALSGAPGGYRCRLRRFYYAHLFLWAHERRQLAARLDAGGRQRGRAFSGVVGRAPVDCRHSQLVQRPGSSNRTRRHKAYHRPGRMAVCRRRSARHGGWRCFAHLRLSP